MSELIFIEKRNIYILLTVYNNNMKVLPSLGVSGEKEEIANLDLRDKKILLMLSQNARTPLSKIAKVANLSRDSIKYRIQGYEKKGVIKKSRTLVDVSKLGYDSYHIFLRLNNPSQESERKIIESLKNLPYVRAILKFHGSYDFEIAVIAKNIAEFDQELEEIIGKTKNYLQDYEILIITKSYRVGQFPNKFIKSIDTKSLYSKAAKKESDYKPDKKDLEIIKVMRDNAQLSLLEIGDKVKLSPDAVSYRLKKMEDSIIIAFVPVINYQALGYSVHALLLNISGLDKDREKKIAEFMKTNQNILWAVKTVGRYNVLAYVCTENERELQDTINELRNAFPEQISHYDSLLAFEEYKYTYAPDCLFS